MDKLCSAEAMITSLEATHREFAARILALEEELSAKARQLYQTKGKVSHLWATVNNLEVHIAQLLAQIVEAQKEVALMKEEVAEVQ